MTKINRMRTIAQCVKEIRAFDPETAITEWFVRSLCANEKIKYFKSGSKYLINLDDFIAFLNFEDRGAHD